MDVDSITRQSLPQIIRDPRRRDELFRALRTQHGTNFPLSNRMAEVAPSCVATARELDELVEVLLPDDPEDLVLDDLAFHPDMSTPTLMRLLTLRRAMNALQHRGGPEEVLLKVAEAEPCAEATLTLALCVYGPDPKAEARFFWFVRKYIHCQWLRQSLRLSDHATLIPKDRLAKALQLAADYEAEHGTDYEPQTR